MFGQDWISEMEDGNIYTAKASFDEFWEGKTPGKGQGYKQFNRWYNQWEPRTYPSGNLSSIRYYEGLVEHKENVANARQHKSSTSQWNSIGPFNPSFGGYYGIGRVNVVEFHPTNSNIIFLGTPGGGLWKSTDAGASWLPLTDDLTNLGISDIAIDPTNPNIMYVATGDRDAQHTYSFGLLKSTDGGTSWSLTGLSYTVQSENTTNRVIIDPNNTSTIIVAAGNGIHRSTDSGISFTHTFTGKQIISMEMNPGNSNIIYAGEYDPWGNTAGIFKSTNNGASWTEITSGLPANDSKRVALAVTPGNTGYVYAVIANHESGLNGVYQSTNSGTSFSLKMSSPNILDWDDGSATNGQAWYDLSLSASPTDPNEIFVGGINVWKSSNGGTSFSKTSHWHNVGIPVVHADQHWFAYQGSSLFICNDGGLFKTTNGGTSFTELTANIAISQIYRLSNDQITNDKVIVGLQDNGTRLKNGAVYDFVLGGDGMECIIDHTDNNVIFGSAQYGDILRSTDGGGSFTQVGPNTGNGAWTTPFVMDPNDHNIMYLGDNEIYKSTNNGVSWTEMTSGLSTELIVNMSISKANSNIVFATTSNQMYRSIDAGVTWGYLGTTSPIAAAITSIYADPLDTTSFFITFSGYISGLKVLKNTDGTWSDISNGLPNLPVNDIIYQEGTAGLLYAGTDAGVYFFDPNTSVWAVYGTGLPNVIVTDLEIQYNQGLLRVATFGRGVWEIPTEPNDPPTASFTSNTTNICAGDDVLFTNTSTGGDSYLWTFEGGSPNSSTDVNPTITYNIPGNYDVEMVTTNSIGSTESEVLGMITAENLPVASFTITYLGGSTYLFEDNSTNADSYSWNFGDGNTSTTNGNVTHEYDDNEAYIVTLTVTNDCTNDVLTDNVTSTVELTQNLEKVVAIYPNPAIDFIEITLPENSESKIKLFNNLGQEVYATTTQKDKYKLNIKHIAEGVYYVQVITNNEKAIKQLIIKR